MGSKYLFTKQYKANAALKLIDNTHIKTSEILLQGELINQSLSDYLELSKEALDKSRSESSKADRVITLEDLKDLDISDKDKLKILLLVKMVKAITGKEMKIFIPRKNKLTPPKIKTPFQNLLKGIYHLKQSDKSIFSVSNSLINKTKI
jgi:hypothetical protein